MGERQHQQQQREESSEKLKEERWIKKCFPLYTNKMK